MVNELVVPPLRSLFVNLRTFIGIPMDLLEFIQLQHPLLPRRLQIKIEVVNRPKCFMFQFYGEMTSFAIAESKRVVPMGVLKVVR